MGFKNAMAWCAVVGAGFAIGGAALGQELRETLHDIDVGERWSYNDWDSASAAAAKSKKPILALFR